MRAMLLVVALAAPAASAFAQENPRNAVVHAQHAAGPARPSKVISRTRQPVGTPHKVSSFAPHPTNKRVFGAPIQPPIVHSAPKLKPKAPVPK